MFPFLRASEGVSEGMPSFVMKYMYRNAIRIGIQKHLICLINKEAKEENYRLFAPIFGRLEKTDYLCINKLTPLPEEQRAQGESFCFMATV